MNVLRTLLRSGRTLGKSHTVERVIGEGGFGVVAKCRNRETNKLEAIKVTHWNRETVQQARSEVRVLRRLQHLDPETSPIVKWNGYFIQQSKFFMNFEVLDVTLHDYVSARGQGLPLPEVRSVLHQLTKALVYMKVANVVHADLKPRNIMVVNRHESPVRVKVIDFGLAQTASQTTYKGTVVQTPPYKAPEVIVYAPFNEAIDMWSLGVIAAEMSVGKQLFPGKSIYDVLRFIIDVQGQPPDHILNQGIFSHFYFRHLLTNTESRWVFRTPKEIFQSLGFQSKDTRQFHIRSLDDLERLIAEQTGPNPDLPLLVDLIKKMLHMDPEKRIKPMEVLRHPFFAESHPSLSEEDIKINTVMLNDFLSGKTPSLKRATRKVATAHSVQSPNDTTTAKPQDFKNTQHYSKALVGDSNDGLDVKTTTDGIQGNGWISRVVQTVKRKIFSYFF